MDTLMMFLMINITLIFSLKHLEKQRMKCFKKSSKIVSQEFDFCNSNSVFATFHCCIRHISRHDFDWHKNCTQNVLTTT